MHIFRTSSKYIFKYSADTRGIQLVFFLSKLNLPTNSFYENFLSYVSDVNKTINIYSFIKLSLFASFLSPIKFMASKEVF